MHKPTEWTDKIFIAEDGAISRMLTAYYCRRIKHLECDVYVENEYGEAGCQNLYYTQYGYVVAFPGDIRNSNPYSYFYDSRIAEEEGFGECRLMPKLGESGLCTEEEIRLVCEKYPAFRYVLNKFKCKTRQTLIDTLRLWKEHPECELVLACGYEKVAHNKVFWKLSKPKIKKVCQFMQQYKNLDIPLCYVLEVINSGKDYDLYIKYLECTDKRDRKIINFDDFVYLRKLCLKNDEYSIHTSINLYRDYMVMLIETEHDIQSEYWRHPKDLYGKHDELVEERHRRLEAEKIALEKKRRKNLKALQISFEKYDLNIDGFRIFVSTDYELWCKHAKALNQCIVAGGYYTSVADGNEVLVFIHKDDIPIATAEVRNDGTVGQFYADERDRDNCLPSEEVKCAFNKWLDCVPKSKFKKRQKKAA